MAALNTTQATTKGNKTVTSVDLSRLSIQLRRLAQLTGVHQVNINKRRGTRLPRLLKLIKLTSDLPL